MYKVEVYKFCSRSTDLFTEGCVYYLRNSKDGVQKFLSTNNSDAEWQIANEKMSLISSHNISYLEDNFKFVGCITFKNYREFKKYSNGLVLGQRELNTPKALAEVEKIESGELPRKSAREFLDESKQ